MIPQPADDDPPEALTGARDPSATLIADPATLRIVASSAGARRLAGLSAAGLARRSLAWLLPDVPRAVLREMVGRLATTDGAIIMEASCRDAGVGRVAVTVELSMVSGSGDTPLVAARLRRSGGHDAQVHGAPAGEIADWLADGVIVVDRGGVVRYANEAAAALFGRGSARVMVGATFGHPLSQGAVSEVDLVQPGGTTIVAEMRVSAATWSGDPCFVAALRDVTARRRAQEEAERAAAYDTLTGLPSRPLLLDRTRRALLASRRDRPAGAPGLVLVDLDRFAHIDDTVGHAAADRLLAQVGRRLADRLRASDSVARLGGDEFGVLMASLRGHAAAEQAARRLLSCFDDPFPLSGRMVHLDASAGVALAGTATDADGLLRQAEHALRAAKAAGRGTFRIYDPGMHEQSRRRLRLEADLRAAVSMRAFAVAYQPIVDLADGTVVDVEALVRWPREGTGEPLAPGEFIPLAEEIGLVGSIDLWVLDRACSDLGEWACRSGGRICVNISGLGFVDSSLPDRVHEVLAAHGLPPSCLRLEITESALMRESETAREVLAALSEHGVELALDDFGTGYSSLSRLRRFPIDVLKVDRSFVAAGDEEIVRVILTLAQNLGMQVIAEGVETSGQADSLLALGCRYGQGWHFAPALERSRLAALIGDA